MITPAWRTPWFQGHQVLLCLVCNLYSFDRRDVELRYCAHCHQHLESLPMDYAPAPQWNQDVRPMTGQRGVPRQEEERITAPPFADVEAVETRRGTVVPDQEEV